MDDSLSVGIAEIAKMEPEIRQITTRAGVLEITNQNEYEQAITLTREIKQLYANVEGGRLKITRKIDEAKRGVMDLFKPITERLSKAEYMLKSIILQYNHKQEEWLKQEEEKLRKEAENEKAKLLKKAEKLEARGNVEKAEEIKQQAAEIVASSSIQLEIPKPGIITRVTWKARIIDANAVPRQYLKPDEEMLNGIARASKGILQIPGVEFYPDESLSISGRY